jgi:predicted secreted protein
MLTRRSWLAGAAGLVLGAGRAAAGERARPGVLRLDLPILTEDPTAVPVIVLADHPMEAQNYVRWIRVSLATDPVPDKGTYSFTPLSGRAWVSFQMRSGVGGLVRAEAESTRQGRLSTSAEVRVAEGGCGVGPDQVDRKRAGNPIVRLPRSYRAGDVIEVRAKVDHGSHTGLVFKEGAYVREMAAYYLTRMVATFEGATVCDFRLTSAVSPNPLIRFTLKVPGPGTLRVRWSNSEGMGWEATQAVRPA